jgi:DNA modification methylase
MSDAHILFKTSLPAEGPDSEDGPNEAGEPEEGFSPSSNAEIDEVLPATKHARRPREPCSDEVDEDQPAKKKARLTQDKNNLASVIEAKAAALLHLEKVDNVFMSCAAFQMWSKTSQCESLHGRVDLILTDPPYNTRRTAGTSNSDHDYLSISEMKEVGDLIAALLRPKGQAYIFCSFMQGPDWMSALRAAGGGDMLAVSEKPEFVIRHESAIVSAGRFMYHRAIAGEVAIHAFKRQLASKPGAPIFDQLFPLGTTHSGNVAFGSSVGRSASMNKLASGSDMPTYASAFDNYRPPSGARQLTVEDKVVRPEQKGVDLLREIMRIFAPKPTDIVVDLFGGTMSTVAGAMMGGHAVYACEPDESCFKAAIARIQALQYRSVALIDFRREVFVDLEQRLPSVVILFKAEPGHQDVIRLLIRIIFEIAERADFVSRVLMREMCENVRRDVQRGVMIES